MDEFGWGTNMQYQWNNINNHQDEQNQENNFTMGSQNIILNPIQPLHKTESSADHVTTRFDAINAPSNLGTPTPWSQPWAANNLPCNRFQEGKNVVSISTTAAAAATVSSLDSLDCLLSGTNSNTDTSADHDDGISAIFSDCKNLWNSNSVVVVTNNNISGVSSGDSVTKEIDDSTLSQCSSENKPNKISTKRSNIDYGFSDHGHNPPKQKRPRLDTGRPSSSNINFQQVNDSEEPDSEAIAQMKEMIYRAAAFRPVSFAAEEVAEKPKRKNVKISSDPQTVAARQRRERISERIRVLQRLVPGGNKMDTASMLDEAANYLKFLRSQVKALEQLGQKLDYVNSGTTLTATGTSTAMPHASVVVPLSHNPVPMQTHLSFPHQNLYPNPPPA